MSHLAVKLSRGDTEERTRMESWLERKRQQRTASDHLLFLCRKVPSPGTQAVQDEHAKRMPREQTLDRPGDHKCQGLHGQCCRRSWAAGLARRLRSPAACQG